MNKVTIFHNPRCSKSRETLKILQEKGIEPEIRAYLKEIPSEEEIKTVLKKLNIKAEQLVRKKEKIFKEKFKGKAFSEEEWVHILAQNPKLIERPIVIKGDKAVIGRPPEQVLTLI